jgi:DNA-directed RNA polymerase specialized sigma24 family protein
MITVETVARRHPEWVRVAIFYGCPLDLSEDVVQDVYVALCEIQRRESSLERLTYNGKLNEAYMFASIKNTVAKRVFREKKRNLKFFSSFHGQPVQEESFLDVAEREQTFQEAVINAQRTLDSMHWYDRQLFDAYLKEGSIRKLHKATDISTRCIHKTIKKVRKTIKQAIDGKEG